MLKNLKMPARPQPELSEGEESGQIEKEAETTIDLSSVSDEELMAECQRRQLC